MNARQFFDVWPAILDRAHAARSRITCYDADGHARHLAREVERRHGDKVATEAVALFLRMFEDAKTGGTR